MDFILSGAVNAALTKAKKKQGAGNPASCFDGILDRKGA
jgi:hypothetical protein